MRVVVVVIAALMTLGLAAFGVVAAQKAAGSTSLVALAAHVISPAQSTDAPATPAAPSKVAAAHAGSVPGHPDFGNAIGSAAQCAGGIRRTDADGPERDDGGGYPSKPRPRRQRRRPARQARQPKWHSAMQQSECARPFAHRRNRHDGRPGLRYRAFQAIRLPARQGGRVDLRRRPVAGQHADGPQGAHRQLHQGDFLRDR